MVELSREKRRDEVQLDKIGRRDGILPDRLGVRAPDYRPTQDMRSARIGDVGGAESLMRTLGVVEKGASDFADYSMKKYAKAEGDNIDKGLADQQMGSVDPAMEKKSLGYSNAVALGRTMTSFGSAWGKFEPELSDFIEQQTDPHLEVRQAEVQAKIDGFYHGFAINPETGKPNDFMQTPASLRYVAGEIGRQRPKLAGETSARIESKFNEEAATHWSNTLVSQAVATGTFDLDAADALLPPSITATARSKMLVTTAGVAAAELDKKGDHVGAVRLLDSVLGTAPHADRPTDSATAAADLTTPSTGKPMAPSAAPSAAPVSRVSFDVLAGAVVYQESRGNKNAVSPKGAVGDMQTMPTTLTDPGFGVRPAKDRSSAELTRVGRDYLKAMLKEYDGAVPLALAAYNAGPGVMDDWLAGTNNTGKNPSRLKLPDPRVKGVSIQAFTAAIPFKETKDYVRNITGRVGLTVGGSSDLGAGGAVSAPDDPVAATPGFRLTRPNADPITLYEQQGTVTPLKGANKVALRPEDRSKLQEQREQAAQRGRAEWKEKDADNKSFAFSDLLMRGYGQGPSLTSVEITKAVEDQQINPAHGATLFGILRASAAERTSYDTRQLGLSDRSEARKREDDAAKIAGSIIKPLLRGDIKSGEALDILGTTLPKISDPKTAMAVANIVIGVSGDKDRMAGGGQAPREAASHMFDKEEEWMAAVRPTDQPAVAAIWNTAHADYNIRIQRGEDPVTAEQAVATRANAKLQRLRPIPTKTQRTPPANRGGSD